MIPEWWGQEGLPQFMLARKGASATGAPHSKAELKPSPPNLSFLPLLPQISLILVNSSSEIVSASQDFLVPPTAIQCTRTLSSSSLDPV